MTLDEAFTEVNPMVGYLRIFGFLIYIHIPKEKRMKLDPSGRKGTFVGYNESSKAYHIYILGLRYIEVSMDVSFEEEVAFRRSRGSHIDIDGERQEEMVSSSPHSSTILRESIDPMETTELVDPLDLVDVPRNIVVGRKKLAWARYTFS
jgi:hypothetical protein